MNEEDLTRSLHAWNAGADLPPSFQREVWRRIELAENDRAAPVGWLDRFLLWVARPLPATAVCALALAIGIAVGGHSGGATPPAAATYANSINPLAKVASR